MQSSRTYFPRAQATLTAFEKQAQEQMDQIQNEIEQEQLQIRNKTLADREAIFNKQLQVRCAELRVCAANCAMGGASLASLKFFANTV